jgi:hypothetical protein
MKQRLKKTLDYVPLIATIAYNLNEWFLFEYGTVLQWQTYLGFAILIATVVGFIHKHQYGVLLTGLLLLLGFAGLISLAPSIFTGGKIGNNSVQIPFGNPIYLLLFIFHFIISARYYTGILTKNYWHQLMNKKAGE